MFLLISPTCFYFCLVPLWCRIYLNFAAMHLLRMKLSLWNVYHVYWPQDNGVFDISRPFKKSWRAVCSSNHRLSGGKTWRLQSDRTPVLWPGRETGGLTFTLHLKPKKAILRLRGDFRRWSRSQSLITEVLTLSQCVTNKAEEPPDSSCCLPIMTFKLWKTDIRAAPCSKQHVRNPTKRCIRWGGGEQRQPALPSAFDDNRASVKFYGRTCTFASSLRSSKMASSWLHSEKVEKQMSGCSFVHFCVDLP